MLQKKTAFLLLICLSIALCSSSQDEIFSKYKVKAFTFKGDSAKIVYPRQKAEHNYWIWRARFWGHAPQLDIALLDLGFHVAYIDVANLFGNDEAVELWNQFYAYCTSEEKLHPKVVLEGMSRGGLIIYNWASKNTEKVFSIYADAPVCDIKSWPGGLFEGTGSAEAWKTCLNAYALDSVSVWDYDDLPINNCLEIAKAKIPVLHVCGLADKVVPYSENTKLLAERFKNAGGTIELINKEGIGHHPHSLKDPKPIVDFILKSIEDSSEL
jgi:pimeloyl-ACP methyl ester carboxylesterase